MAGVFTHRVGLFNPAAGGGSFPVVEEVARGNSTTDTTSRTVTLPATINAGDLLLAMFSADGNTVVTWDNATAGAWTQLHQAFNGSSVGAIFYKIADGTEDGATLTITTSNNQQTAWQIFRISGRQGSPEHSVDVGSSFFNPPSLTPSWGDVNTLWLAFAMWNDGTIDVTAGPASYTNLIVDRANTAGGCGVTTARRELNAASEDPGNFTESSSALRNVGVVAIRPA